MLFEGYYKDYGPEGGEKIVRALIDVLGGCRVTIPKRLTTNPDNNQILLDLFRELSRRFKQASGEAIMRNFLMELKGCRISFPSIQTLSREERNRTIRAKFTGGNYGELALRFGLTKGFVKRMIDKTFLKKGKDISREKK